MPDQNFAERLAYDTVILPVIGEKNAELVHSNYEVDLERVGKRYIDFAIISATSRVAIEIDGYNYHAPGIVSREKFDDDLSRQNELTIRGWKVIRYSFDQISKQPSKCQDQLRRAVVSDTELHPAFRPNLEPSTLQQEVLGALSTTRKMGFSAGLVCLPTGTGKTILSALDSKVIGGRVLFVVHSNEILKQAAAAYKKVHKERTFGFINSQVETRAFDEDLIFANIASLRSLTSLSSFDRSHFDYIVLDEFHHGAAPSYQALLAHFEPKFTLGLTATPLRTDGKNVLKLLQNNLVYSINLSTAIERGFLVPFTYRGLHDNVDYTSIRHNGIRYDIDDLERSLFIPKRNEAILKVTAELVQSRQTIGFCVSIKHAEQMAQLFQSAGYSATEIHSNLSLKERCRRIESYASGTTQFVFVRDLFNEGVDFPNTEAVLFLRPTESKVVFVQQMGRGLRLSPKKSNALILDFIGNYIGSDDIPAMVRKAAGDERFESPFGKPEFHYDNGCEIIFSEDVIEHLQFAEYELADKTKIISKVMGLFERLKRPLNALDIFLLLKSDFGRALRTFGGFKGLTARMNTLSDDLVITSEAEDATEDAEDAIGDYGETFMRTGQTSIQLVEAIIFALKRPRQPKADFTKIFSKLHADLNRLLELLTPICLLKDVLPAYASREAPSMHGARIELGEAYPTLDVLKKRSFLRNSHALANGIEVVLVELERLLRAPESTDENFPTNFLEALMTTRSLQSISDLHALTDGLNIHL